MIRIMRNPSHLCEDVLHMGEKCTFRWKLADPCAWGHSGHQILSFIKVRIQIVLTLKMHRAPTSLPHEALARLQELRIPGNTDFQRFLGEPFQMSADISRGSSPGTPLLKISSLICQNVFLKLDTISGFPQPCHLHPFQPSQKVPNPLYF